jgi:hypothetical protein
MERLWMRVGVVRPLLDHVAGYAAMLEARGYSDGTVDDSVRLVAQLSRWLANEERPVGDLSPVVLEQFLQTRRKSGHRTRSPLAYAPLLKHLGGSIMTSLAPTLEAFFTQRRSSAASQYTHSRCLSRLLPPAARVSPPPNRQGAGTPGYRRSRFGRDRSLPPTPGE